MFSHIEAPISNLSEIIDYIQASTLKFFAVIDLANVLCSVLVSTGSNLHFASSLERTQYTFNWLPIGHVNDATIGYNLCWQSLNHAQLFPGAQV